MSVLHCSVDFNKLNDDNNDIDDDNYHAAFADGDYRVFYPCLLSHKKVNVKWLLISVCCTARLAAIRAPR